MVCRTINDSVKSLTTSESLSADGAELPRPALTQSLPALTNPEALQQRVAAFPYCLTHFSGGVAATTAVDGLPIGGPAALRARTDRLVCDADFNPADFKHPDQLGKKADYIAAEFEKTGANVERQPFLVDGKSYSNVIARFGSRDPNAPLRIIGFHYDKHGELPGAKDNDLSVAVGLELARELGQTPPQNVRVQLVAYTLEECSFPKGKFGEDPNHPSGMDHIAEERCFVNHQAFLGSQVHAESIRNERSSQVVVLDSIGSYSNKPGSQSYPSGAIGRIAEWQFGDRGNFVAVVGSLTSRALGSRVADTIKKHTGLTANASAAPQIGYFEDYFRSDHVNYPNAVLLTDTTNFRMDDRRVEDYHGANDTPDRVKYSKVAKVAAGLSAWLKEEDRVATPDN